MKIIGKIWKNTKIQPDIWLFYGFLLTFTLSLRKVLFYFPIKGTFNEYAGIYIYISDIFLFLTLVSWPISILCNDSISLSICKLWISCLPHKLSPMSSSFFQHSFIFLPLSLIIWSFMSILWSDNQAIAFFRSIKILEFFLLYIYIIFRFVPRIPYGMFHVEQFLQDGTFSQLL